MPGTDLGSIARRWLSPGPASPWRFDDGGDALVWSDGETVAFRAEVEASLRRVATNLEIVPPFPAVALLVAAVRAEDRQVSSAHWDLVRDAMETATPWLFARVAAVKEVAETASALRMLEHVPDELFARPGALPFLVEAVFEGAGLRRDPKGAAVFLRDLDAEPTPGSAQPGEDETRRQAVEWGEGLAALRTGLGRLDPSTLARRARTGIDGDVLPAELAWPDAIQVRGLIASLRGDPDLGAVARLATDVMAAVRLPRPGASPEDLPIGGYADLTNRGSPERLLISELAHDGLTLAVRVALHEALYLRREAPPRAPQGTRCVLIDAGIRLWGVGRVFATSVALALAATSERGVSVRAWRARGRRVERVDLGSREGIDAHLEALEAEPHPTAALRPFLAECTALSGGVECCIVTHANALEEPEMREALRAAGRVVYVVTVTATGDLVLHVFTPTGSQTLRTAKLDLAALLEQASRTSGRRPALTLRDPVRDDPDLPAILRLERLPLRIPHSLQDAAFREAPGVGVVARTSDRRLVLWTHAALGPVELADHTPRGALRVFGVTNGFVHLVTAGGAGVPTSWMRADLESMTVETRELRSIGKTPSAAAVFGEHGEMVGLVSNRTMYVVDAEDTSRVAHEVALPAGALFAHGRFFRRGSTGAWWVLAPTGDGASFEALPVDDRREVQTVFDRSGTDGPWALLRDPLRVLDLSSGRVIPLPPMDAVDFELACVGSAGHRLIFASRSTGRAALVDLREDPPKFVPVVGRHDLHAEPMIASLHAPDLRRRATIRMQIGITADGVLALGNGAIRTRLDGSLVFDRSERVAPGFREQLRHSRSFTAGRASLPGCHWDLSTARWEDGSRALFDSRGMLHLVSSDRSVPEVTLAIAAHRIAAWCSDGVSHGERYFLGDALSVPGTEILRRVARFTERLR